MRVSCFLATFILLWVAAGCQSNLKVAHTADFCKVMLQSEDVGQRLQAVQELSDRRDAEGFFTLAGALRDDDLRVRHAAGFALVAAGSAAVKPMMYQRLYGGISTDLVYAALLRIGPKSAMPLFEWVQENGDSVTRQILTETLRKFGPQTLDVAILAMKRYDEVAPVLGEINNERAMKALCQAYVSELDSNPASDRGFAYLRALKNYDSRKCGWVLEQALLGNEVDSWVACASMQHKGAVWHVPSLLYMLEVKHSRVAAYTLGIIGDPKAIPALKSAAKQGDQDLRLSALKALVMLGLDEGLDELLNVVTDESQPFERRSEMIDFLQCVKGPRRTKVLMECLKSKNGWLVDAAVSACADYGIDEAAGPITELLDSDNELVVWAAVRALGQLHVTKAAPKLVELVKNGKWGRPGEPTERMWEGAPRSWVLACTLITLGQIGHEPAADMLISAIDLDDELASHVSLGAIVGLGNLRSPKAVDALSSVMESPHEDLRIPASSSLLSIGDRKALEVLSRYRNDFMPEIANHAAEASKKLRQLATRPAK